MHYDIYGLSELAFATVASQLRSMSAFVVSGVLCSLSCALILISDSFFLLLPHSVPAKLADANAMRTVYGPCIGHPNGDKFDGMFVMSFLLPAAVCVWINTVTAQVTAVFCLVAGHVFLLAIGYYMSITAFLPGYASLLFFVLSSVFGGNFLWRALDDDFGVPKKYAPALVSWHAMCFAVITACYLTLRIG